MPDQALSTRYRAFGLTIASELPIRELDPETGNGPADISIRCERLRRRPPTREQGPVVDYLDPDGVYMAWPGVAAFQLVGDNSILIEPCPEAPTDYLAFPLLGTVIGWLLLQRGFLVLHASAVEVNGRSVVLMGDKMAGKSTTAAAFLRAGHRLITDDVLAIDMHDPRGPRLMPSFAQLKLTHESSAAIQLERAEALPLVYEGFVKRQHRLPEMYRETIGADFFYVLARGGDRPRIVPLHGSAALEALIRYSYIIRYRKAPFSADMRAAHFRHCAAVANCAHISTLHVPASLEALADTVELVVSSTRPDRRDA